jgi:hypothetical protein
MLRQPGRCRARGPYRKGPPQDPGPDGAHATPRGRTRLAGIALLALLPAVAVPGRAGAEPILYATAIGNNNPGIFKFDLATPNPTPVPVLTGVAADSLIFDLNNRIIFTASALGEVRAVGTATPLLTGLNSPGDLTLDPTRLGNSALVSDRGGKRIDRFDLNGAGRIATLNVRNVVVNGTALGANAHPQGITWNAAGTKLYAILSSNVIAQLNDNLSVTSNLRQYPASVVPTGASLDGLTFDPKTGHLFAGLLGSPTVFSESKILEIDPTDLHVIRTILTPGVFQIDGLEADENGNVFFTSRNDPSVPANQFRIFELDAGTTNIHPVARLPGLDDIAPLAGAGAPGPGPLAGVPEPGTLALLGLGVVGLGAYGWRRRRRVA